VTVKSLKIALGFLAAGGLAVAVALFVTAPRPFSPDTESGRRLAPGPFAVATTELEWVDTARPTDANGDYAGAPERRLPVAIWHPIGAPGHHPLLVYSHGFMSTRFGGRYLAEHLASHGYVVMATDYPLSHFGAPGGPKASDVVNQPADVSFLIDQILALPSGDRPFTGELDSARIGAFGLSLGGLTTSLVAFHPKLRDPRIHAALSIAGPGVPFTARFYESADLPFLMIGGTADAMIDYELNAAPLPARIRRGGLVTIQRATHAGFDDMAGGVMRLLGNLDGIGCRSLMANLHLDKRKQLFAGLGSADMGVIDPGDQAMPCRKRFDSVMTAGLQHQLTTLIVRAFFDSQFLDDPHDRAAAEEFLTRVMPAERGEIEYQPARAGASVANAS
jgi:predicted dienelactone hydrolase